MNTVPFMVLKRLTGMAAENLFVIFAMMNVTKKIELNMPKNKFLRHNLRDTPKK
jgi:hypothetical protein